MTTGDERMAQDLWTAVEEFGHRYIREHLNEETLSSRYGGGKSDLPLRWWPSVRFFFGRSFYRGRRDQLSRRFEDRTLDVLTPRFSKLEARDAARDGMPVRIDEDLLAAGVNNGADRAMVADTLELVFELPNANVVAWAKECIESGKMRVAFNRLLQIRSVGPKIASFFLRDISLLYDLTECIGDDVDCVQPVDTWVTQVSRALGMAPVTPRSINIECRAHGVDPLKYNAGAWYLGAGAFKIVLGNLARLDPCFRSPD
jgi:hypothetical protein